MNRDKALEQWRSVKSTKGSDLPMLLLDMKQAKDLDKKKKATRKETEKAKKELVAAIQKDIALEKKKATLTDKTTKRKKVEHKVIEKELADEEIQLDKDALAFDKDQAQKKKAQTKAATVKVNIAKTEAITQREAQLENTKLLADRARSAAKKKSMPKAWATVMRKYEYFEEDLRGALVNPETVSVDDIVQFRSTLKGLYADVQKYKSLAGVDSVAFIKRLDWHRKRLVDLEQIVIAQAKLDLANHVQEKKEIADAKEALADAQDLLELYQRTGDTKKIAQAQEAVTEAQARINPQVKGRFAGLVDQTRDEEGVIGIRKGVALALSWVGKGAGKGVGRAVGGLGAIGKGAYAKAVGGLLKAADGSPNLVRAVKGLDKTTRFLGSAVKAIGVESFKWVGKKLGQLTGMVSGFLRNPLQGVGGFGGLIGLAALASTIVKPALEGIDAELKSQYGDKYLSNFIDGLWDKSWAFLVRQVKKMLGISTESEDTAEALAEANRKKEAASKNYAAAQEAYKKSPTAENKANLDAAKAAFDKSDDVAAVAQVQVTNAGNRNFGLAGADHAQDVKDLQGRLVEFQNEPDKLAKIGLGIRIQGILHQTKRSEVPEELATALEKENFKFDEPAKAISGRGSMPTAGTDAAAPSGGRGYTGVSAPLAGRTSAPAASAAPVTESRYGNADTAATPVATIPAPTSPAASPVATAIPQASSPTATPAKPSVVPTAASPAASASPTTAKPDANNPSNPPQQINSKTLLPVQPSVKVSQIPSTMGSDGWIIHNGVGLVGT